MLLDAPDWAEIKNANAAYLAMIAAWVAAIATLLAAIFAAIALRWARSAAAAAQGQMKLLEKQIALSEPQPVVMLNVKYVGDAGNPVIEFENVGEELAFDLHLSELIGFSRGEDKRKYSVRFVKEPILKSGSSKVARVIDNQSVPQGPLSKRSSETGLFEIFSDFTAEVLAAPYPPPAKDGLFALRPITLTYRNARGFGFETRFIVAMRDIGSIECVPEWSLVDSRKREVKPAIT